MRRGDLRRTSIAAILATLALTFSLAACSDPAGPGPNDGEVSFSTADTGGDYSASGDLVLQGGVPAPGDWAVSAEPDSLAGVVISALDTDLGGDTGRLFILQLQPARTGTFTCGPDGACRGRLFLGWKVDVSGYGAWLEITDGTVDVDELNERHVSGTFTFTLRDEGGTGSVEFHVLDGVFDVPFDRDVASFICGVPPIAGCLT